MSDLFTTEVDDGSEVKRGLPGATIVKTKAVSLASQIMAKIPTADADFIGLIKESQSSVASMDALVKQECGDALNDADVATFDKEEAQKLLKSNQSNRSRRKSMPMTQSNYIEMLTASIAEWIIRESCDMEKSATGFLTGRTAMVIDENTVAELAKDQDLLGKAIRNIQSKKSTFKSKHLDVPNYEQDEEWQELLKQEQMLKAVRTTTATVHRKGVSIKKALQFIFEGTASTDKLNQQQCYDLIEACRNLADGKYPDAFIAEVTAGQADKEATATTSSETQAPTTDQTQNVYTEI